MSETIAEVSQELSRVLRTVESALRRDLIGRNFHHVELKFVISGRPTGDLKVETKLDINFNGAVTGKDFLATFVEALRRLNWEALNAPLMLSYDGSTREGADNCEAEVEF